MMSLNPPMVSWQGKRVWLVGASSGIGRALAEALWQRGARVALSARRTEALQAVVSRAGVAAEQVCLLPLDATEPGAARAAVAQLRQQWGGCDLVVYCAGYFRAMRARDLDLDEVLRHQSVNLTGVWHWLDAVLPMLREQGHGHIALMASVAGYGGLPQALAYGPTKAALINLAECLYMDLRDEGVAVSVINPGFVDTPLTAQNTFAMPALQTPTQAAQAILQGWARGRFEIHFPKRFTRLLKALHWLPYGAYFRLVRKGTGL